MYCFFPNHFSHRLERIKDQNQKSKLELNPSHSQTALCLFLCWEKSLPLCSRFSTFAKSTALPLSHWAAYLNSGALGQDNNVRGTKDLKSRHRVVTERPSWCFLPPPSEVSLYSTLHPRAASSITKQHGLAGQHRTKPRAGRVTASSWSCRTPPAQAKLTSDSHPPQQRSSKAALLPR